MENQWYTISVYSENHVGLLNRISGIFLKRHINIESLNVSKSEIESVSKFTIVVKTTEDWTQKIVNQIEKQIDVIKAFYHTDEEIIRNQLCSRLLHIFFLTNAKFRISSRKATHR